METINPKIPVRPVMAPTVAGDFSPTGASLPPLAEGVPPIVDRRGGWGGLATADRDATALPARRDLSLLPPPAFRPAEVPSSRKREDSWAGRDFFPIRLRLLGNIDKFTFRSL